MKQLKKITGLILLVVILAPLAYLSYFQVKQVQLKQRAKQDFENRLVNIIVIAESDVEWTQPGKTLSFHGRVFEVKSFILQSGVYTLTGIFDDEHAALLNQFRDSWKTPGNSNSNKLLVQLILLFNSGYFNHSETGGFLPVDNELPGGIALNDFLHSAYLTVPTPPPLCC